MIRLLAIVCVIVLNHSCTSTSQVLVENEKTNVCPEVLSWEAIETALTQSGDVVNVQQSVDSPQLFYTVRCKAVNERKRCNYMAEGIDSICETRYNVVPAIVLDAIGDPTWAMIQIPGQCVCSVIRNSTLQYNSPPK